MNPPPPEHHRWSPREGRGPKAPHLSPLQVSMHWVGQDLDLSCILLGRDGTLVAIVSFLTEEFAGPPPQGNEDSWELSCSVGV